MCPRKALRLWSTDPHECCFTALIAVAGTLLGSLLTFAFQRKTANRAEQFSRSERLRQERLSVYSEFAGFVLAFRSAQYDEWAQRNEDGKSPTSAEAKTEALRRRAAAWQALYRVRLVADDTKPAQLAQAAMDLTATMHDVEDRAALRERANQVRQAIEEFVSASSAQITETSGGKIHARKSRS